MLGFEPLTLAPFDLRLVERDLLNDAELDWLNEYHVKVRDTIGPYLEGETLDWLQQATRILQ